MIFIVQEGAGGRERQGEGGRKQVKYSAGSTSTSLTAPWMTTSLVLHATSQERQAHALQVLADVRKRLQGRQPFFLG
jgi:hypothetical protein